MFRSAAGAPVPGPALARIRARSDCIFRRDQTAYQNSTVIFWGVKLFGWIKSKLQKATTDAMRDDLERFLVSLKGASSTDLSDVLVMATIVRLDLEKENAIMRDVLDGHISGTLEADTLPLKVNRFIAALQKQGRPELAAGAMVWLHSLRAMQEPQLRLLGRQMWGELERGASAIEPNRILEGIKLGHLSDDFFDELEFVPLALWPQVD